MNAQLAPVELVKTGLVWDNTFYRLGKSFFTPLAPQPLGQPYWVGRSLAVADLLGLEHDWLETGALLQALSGNMPISGTQPLVSQKAAAKGVSSFVAAANRWRMPDCPCLQRVCRSFGTMRR